MKPNHTLFLSLALVLTFPLITNAATLTCSDIERSVQNRTFKKTAFKTNRYAEEAQRIRLFKKALALAEVETAKYIKRTPIETLLEEFDPQYKNYMIAGKKFQGVNLSLGDNPYIYLFNMDQETFSGIASWDGSVVVDGKYCNTGSGIF